MITGTTRIVPIVGHPVGQVHSPRPANAWLRERGLDAAMIAMDIAPDAIEGFFAVLRGWGNCAGCSITLPHKQAALAAMDAISPRCARIGAVNTIRRTDGGRLEGEMTDGLALCAALAEAGHPVAGRTVALAGAGGGAGAAIADALAEQGAAAIHLIEPDAGRLARLRAVLAATWPGVALPGAAPAAVDIAINASPMGMDPADPLPLTPAILRPGGVAADAVTKPPMTPFLRAAHDRGLTVVTGAAMAEAQLRFQMAHWGLAG